MLGLLAGAYGMYRGHKAMGDVAKMAQPSEKSLRSTFSGSQGLIDRMTNFNQYSGGAMDLATQAGNQGVQDAMMMGMGGSQANAIKNRLKQSGVNKAYQSFQGGLGNAAQLQSGIDRNIAGQMQAGRNNAMQAKLGQAGAMMGMGQGLMGQDGLSTLGGHLDALGQTGMGLLGRIPGFN